MPRKISEITDGVFVTARLSKQQRDMYYDLGGHDWLRNYLNRQIRSEEIQLGLSQCTEIQTSSNSQKTNPVSFKLSKIAWEKAKQQ